MREKTIEHQINADGKKRGICPKFVSGYDGMPDRDCSSAQLPFRLGGKSSR